MKELIRAEGLIYRGDGYRQLTGLNLFLLEGEALGVVGRSGSGLTSLFQLLAGEASPDQGTVYLDNRPATREDLAGAAALIRRESRLIDHLTVGENLFVPYAAKAGGLWLRRRAVNAQARILLKELDLELDPDDPVESLAPVLHHLLLMAKYVLLGKRVLLLHHTALEYSAEEQAFFRRRLALFAGNGVAVVWGANRWDRILESLGRIAVVREGSCVKTLWEGPHSKDTVYSYTYGIAGRGKTVPLDQGEGEKASGNLTLGGISLAAGEFVGILDSDGTGRQLAEELAAESRRAGVKPVVMGGDSVSTEWIGSMSVGDNLLLPVSRRVSGPGGHVSRRVRRVLAGECASRMGIPLEVTDLPMEAVPKKDRLRLLFFRWGQLRPGLYLFYNPAMGCDLQERQVLYDEIKALLDRKLPVLYLSTDLRELQGLTARIYHWEDGLLQEEQR